MNNLPPCDPDAPYVPAGVALVALLRVAIQSAQAKAAA